MSKKTKKQTPDFLNDFIEEEVEVSSLWEWITFGSGKTDFRSIKENEAIIGWFVDLKTEKFKERENLVAYFAEVGNSLHDVNPIRFIVPTDLKYKIKAFRKRFDNISGSLVKIVYKGEEETDKGWKIKRFELKTLKDKQGNYIPIPEDVLAYIYDEDFNFDF